MRLRSKGTLLCTLLTLGVLLAVWQFQQHLRQRRELLVVETELRNIDQKLETRRAALAEAERRNRDLVEAERRAGNATLISLMRERAAATEAASENASGLQGVGRALAELLDNPEQRALDREQVRHRVKAGSVAFVKLVHLSPAKADQYVDLNTEMECRKTARMAALLRGRISLDEALRERDADYQESQQRLREIVGEKGYAFYQSIADGMRADEAGRMVKQIQDNLGAERLNPAQSDRLKNLIKTEIANLNMDDTDLFRTPADWARVYAAHQENVLVQAAALLSPAQMDALRTLAAQDLEQKSQEMSFKRKSLGIK